MASVKKLDWVYAENAEGLALLVQAAGVADVVVTHHLPSQRSVAPRLEGSQLNAFFVCDCERIIEEGGPGFWIHGHTHTVCDYQLGETRVPRVLCNPFGYRGEGQTGFVEKLVVEVGGAR